MSSTMASNAILAKARAMYGKSLSETDYKQLMDCRNVPEVAAYLKTRTCYKTVLTGLNESEVHRGQLEPMLRQDVYFDVFSGCIQAYVICMLTMVYINDKIGD